MEEDKHRIEDTIRELKELQNIGILPKETQDEIDMAIEFAESLMKNTGELTQIPDNHKIPIKFINKSEFKNPTYAKEGDSGFDLRATEGGTLNTLERKLVPTGLFFELPDGYELQIRPRSGIAYRHGITVLNSPGTVDTSYRGEIMVLLVNLSNDEFTWEKGDRIAQGVVSHRISSDFGDLIEVMEINETDRGVGGFGSTGNK